MIPVLSRITLLLFVVFTLAPVANAAGIPQGTALIDSGPITISGKSDVTITGKRITNPNGNCVDIKGGSTNIVIENSEIGPCGDIGI